MATELIKTVTAHDPWSIEDETGSVEVARYASGNIYLTAADYTGLHGKDNPVSGVVVMTPEEALAVGLALVTASGHTVIEFEKDNV